MKINEHYTEIFEEYRRKGYGYDASISLHNKVGFETDYYEYVNGTPAKQLLA